jgi:DNA-binding CsgD family transcriptional regulator
MAPVCVTRRSSRRPAERATDRELGVVAAVIAAGSEKAAAHRLGLSHSTVKHHLANARSKVGAETTAQLVWILAPRLLEPAGMAQADDWGSLRMGRLRAVATPSRDEGIAQDSAGAAQSGGQEPEGDPSGTSRQVAPGHGCSSVATVSDPCTATRRPGRHSPATPAR